MRSSGLPLSMRRSSRMDSALRLGDVGQSAEGRRLLREPRHIAAATPDQLGKCSPHSFAARGSRKVRSAKPLKAGFSLRSLGAPKRSWTCTKPQQRKWPSNRAITEAQAPSAETGTND